MESNGEAIDLHFIYLELTRGIWNLSPVVYKSYVDYIRKFSFCNQIPFFTKRRKQYKTYLDKIFLYFITFFEKIYPFRKKERVEENLNRKFDRFYQKICQAIDENRKKSDFPKVLVDEKDASEEDDVDDEFGLPGMIKRMVVYWSDSLCEAFHRALLCHECEKEFSNT